MENNKQKFEQILEDADNKSWNSTTEFYMFLMYQAYELALTESEATIENLASEIVELKDRLAGKWISVDDGLPADEIVVLVWAIPIKYMPEIGGRRLAYWFEGDWYTGVSGIKGSTVTHWQPLPTPPIV